MVDLPKIPRRLALTEAPESSLTRSDLQAPYAALAGALGQASKATEDVAEPLAERAGAAAVRTDDDGNLVVDRSPLPILGRAGDIYDKRVKLTYLANVEPKIETELTKLRLEHRADPDGFRKAGTAFVDQIAGDVQDPLLRSSVRAAALSKLEQNVRSSLVQADRDAASNFFVATKSRINDLDNKAAALARQPGGTETPEYKGIVADIGAAYRELGGDARFRYPRERIDSDLREMTDRHKGEALTGAVLDTLDKQGPEAARQQAEAIRSDPSLNLTPQERDRYFQHAMSALGQRVRAEAATDRTAMTAIENVAGIAAKGFQPSPDELAATQRAVDASRNPAVQQTFDAVKATMPIIADWRRMSPAQLEADLGRLEAGMREKGASEGQVALLGTGRKLLAEMRKQMPADPLGWADRTGTMPIPPIDFAAADAPAQMRSRVALAETVAQHYGVTPTYLRPAEKRALESATAAGGVPMLATAKAIADGFGDRAGRVLAEVSKDAPVLAHLGGLLNGGLFGGGSATFAADVAEAVEIRRAPDYKKPTAAEQTKVKTAQGGRAREAYGGAFALIPDNGRAAEASARDAFFARANRRGYDPLLEQSDSRIAFDRALQEGAGAMFAADGTQYGGVVDYRRGPWIWSGSNKVVVPSTIRADRFADVIGAIRDEDLALMPVSPEAAPGRPYTARDLRNAVPVAVPGGYRLAAGDPTSDDPRWIRGADGQPFVLDLERLEPELRKRVPGAFTGG